MDGDQSIRSGVCFIAQRGATEPKGDLRPLRARALGFVEAALQLERDRAAHTERTVVDLAHRHHCE